MIIMNSVSPVSCIQSCLLSASAFSSTIDTLTLHIPKVALLYFLASVWWNKWCCTEFQAAFLFAISFRHILLQQRGFVINIFSIVVKEKKYNLNAFIKLLPGQRKLNQMLNSCLHICSRSFFLSKKSPTKLSFT